MTDSRAWIDTRDDEAFKMRVEAATRFGRIGEPSPPWCLPYVPPAPAYYWINALRAWAQRRGLAIERLDTDYISEQIAVTREALRQFVTDLYGPAGGPPELVHLIDEDLCDGFTYLIVADEY